jgi:hypothetical protein
LPLVLTCKKQSLSGSKVYRTEDDTTSIPTGDEHTGGLTGAISAEYLLLPSAGIYGGMLAIAAVQAVAAVVIAKELGKRHEMLHGHHNELMSVIEKMFAAGEKK